MTREDVATSCEIWPESILAFNLFRSLATQWHVGMKGVTGLNYQTAYSRMDRMSLSADEYNQLDQDLQVMEVAALNAMQSKD